MPFRQSLHNQVDPTRSIRLKPLIPDSIYSQSCGYKNFLNKCFLIRYRSDVVSFCSGSLVLKSQRPNNSLGCSSREIASDRLGVQKSLEANLQAFKAARTFKFARN
jgi:hypothetical protein